MCMNEGIDAVPDSIYNNWVDKFSRQFNIFTLLDPNWTIFESIKLASLCAFLQIKMKKKP